MRYLRFKLLACAAALLALPGFTFGEPEAASSHSEKFLVYNEAAWELGQRNTAPQSIRDIERNSVDKVAGTGVKIYQLCLLTGAVAAVHRSQILEPYASTLSAPHKMHMWRFQETVRSLAEQGTDILEIVIRRCREVGMEPHASFRVNDPHHTYSSGGGDFEHAVKFRHEILFPDLRTNWINTHQHLCLPSGSFDFSHEEIRDWKLAAIREVLENYDIDGLELDFTRIRPFFKDHEKSAGTALMTAWVEQIRGLINEKGRKRGTPIKLTVRVEFDSKVNLAEGLDVETWVKNGLIDMICLGVIGDATPDASADWFIELCRGTKCLVCPCLEGFFYWYGKDHGAVRTTSLENARAAAAAYYQAGANGIQLYNFCATDTPWDRRIVEELGEPSRIAFSDKHYVFTLAPDANWAKVLPWESRFVLRHGQDKAEYRFVIGDDIERARGLSIDPRGTLKLQIDALNRKDDVLVTLNDVPLEPLPKAENKYAWDSFSVDVLYYEVPSEALRNGEQVLQLKRNRTYPGFVGHTEVQECELKVEYPREVPSSALK